MKTARSRKPIGIETWTDRISRRSILRAAGVGALAGGVSGTASADHGDIDLSRSQKQQARLISKKTWRILHEIDFIAENRQRTNDFEYGPLDLFAYAAAWWGCAGHGGDFDSCADNPEIDAWLTPLLADLKEEGDVASASLDELIQIEFTPSHREQLRLISDKGWRILTEIGVLHPSTGEIMADFEDTAYVIIGSYTVCVANCLKKPTDEQADCIAECSVYLNHFKTSGGVIT